MYIYVIDWNRRHRRRHSYRQSCVKNYFPIRRGQGGGLVIRKLRTERTS